MPAADKERLVRTFAAAKAEGKSVVDLHGFKKIRPYIGAECDVWIPAAHSDVLREDNVDRLKVRLLFQGANIPATRPGAEQRMHERGICAYSTSSPTSAA